MTDNIVLRATGIGKRFKLYPTPWHRALEWASLGRRPGHTDFWAVRNISFEVRRGDCLGIIGVNGAGKSTLLKLVTGVLPPTEGTYQVQGQVLSLLELGIGLNERLTGRQNVIASAQLLAFPDRYAQQRMPQILEFSELGPFFDRPVAIYSTGMRMRLAFSLFAFFDGHKIRAFSTHVSHKIITFQLKPGTFAANSDIHTLALTCNPWRPWQLGSTDPRELGLPISLIEFSPI
jgi:lipopolysaccharide transport system ATP-binding protein